MSLGERGQSEVVGTALILGITIISIALVVAIAGAALDDTRNTTDIESTEHAMSQLDSRAALVALGRTDSQTVAMGRARSGTYTIDEDAGWLRITHHNYTPGSDEVLYEGTLGAILYEYEGRTIAYQGGGVWRSDGGNGSVLVSPPEFHYRRDTLTIPVIQVRNAGPASVSGGVTVRLQSSGHASAVFPNSSKKYPNGDIYENAIDNGSVTVSVHSEYYTAWASFFRDRSDGDVTVDHENETTSVELVVPAVHGAFDMPLDGESLVLRGIGDKHALDELNLTIAPDDADSADFSDLQWSMYAEDGSEKLELHIRSSGSTGCSDSVQGTIYYTDGTDYQGWKNPSAFQIVCKDWNGDGDDEARVVANWTSTTAFEYSSLSSSDLGKYNPKGDLEDPVEFDHHSGTVSWEPVTYNETETAPVNGTIAHYVAFFGPTAELTIEDKGGGGASGGVNEGASYGSVEYGSGNDFFVTYIHATENPVNVTLT